MASVILRPKHEIKNTNGLIRFGKNYLPWVNTILLSILVYKLW